MSHTTNESIEENTSSTHSSIVVEEEGSDTPNMVEKGGILSTHMERKEGLWHNPKGWAVVFANFLVNFFCTGLAVQWGNYQHLYLQVYGDQTDISRISFVGTIQMAALLSSGVVLTVVIQKIGYRGTMAIGAVMAPSGLILASLATSPWHIYLSQGILFGVGSGFCFASALALPSQFFKKHRALATGISVSGSGFGGMALSPMTEGLISTMGYRNALRVQGGMGFGILFLATALGFSKVRPGGHEGGKGRKFVIVDWSIMSCDLLLLMMFCLLVTFSYPACYYYIPQYTNYIGLDAVHGAFLISITAASNSLSRISMGFLADRLGNMNVMLGCSLASGLFTSLLWQFSSSYGAYTVYCVFCGLTVGVFVSLLPMVIADIVGVLNIQHGIGFCYSTMVFGVLLGAPISGKLLQNYSWTVAIQFIGATTLVASLFLGWLRMKQTKGKLLMII